MKNRNNIFDAIKALAIWLVVLGHCVQYFSGVDFWNDRLFQFIYSFHMPLFFMMSGFFFASSMKLSLWEFLRKKSLTLLLPCFVWGTVLACTHYRSLALFAKDVLFPTHWPFWFFKGLFLVQLVAYLSIRIAERIGGGANIRLYSSVLISLVVYIMPYMGVARVMMPIFWVGYIMKIFYEQYIRNHRLIGVIALVVFAGLYYFWNGDTMHYSASASVTLYHVLLGKHGYTIMNLLMLSYRILLGMAGCIAIISAMHEIRHLHRSIAIIGASTAGIYILQTFILQIGLGALFEQYIDLSNWPLWANYGLMVIISLLLLALITYMYRWICRSAILDLLFFGCGEKTKVTK